jgi:hypothetical protein
MWLATASRTLQAGVQETRTEDITMSEQQARVWDRHQWAGAPANHATEATGAKASWNLAEWVGYRRGIARAAIASAVEPDGLPHGFSGFGVSDSGGQRWAAPSRAALPARRPAVAAIHAARGRSA